MADRASAPSGDAAWQLDESVSVAAEGGTIAGIPGLWAPGVAVHPDAFGMSVDDFRKLVEALDLPLVEVAADGAIREYDRSGEAGRLHSEDVRVQLGAAPAPEAAPTPDAPAPASDDEKAEEV